MWFPSQQARPWQSPFCVSHQQPCKQNHHLGPVFNGRSTLDRPGLQLQTDPQEESGPSEGEIFREPNGWLSLGLKVKASICSKKLVYFLRTGRPPAPPGPIQPTLHILLLWELKINRYALKNTQTHLPSTPLPESLTARDANLSGSETQTHATSFSGFNHRLRWLRKPPPLGPTPHTHLLQPLGRPTLQALEQCPRPQPPPRRVAPEVPGPPSARTPPSDPARPHPARPAPQRVGV